jgi:hypothetical protein
MTEAYAEAIELIVIGAEGRILRRRDACSLRIIPAV